LATNVLESDIPDEFDTEIKLTPAVLTSGIGSVTELRELIRSPEMYKNPVVFHIMCAGIESGTMKFSRKRPPTRLLKLITVAHEAHFRLELWLALMKQGFRHKKNNSWNDKRKEYWNEFCKLVAQDRKDNEETASFNRLGLAKEHKHDDSDNDEEGDIDPEYY
jgi:hypothetical protein